MKNRLGNLCHARYRLAAEMLQHSSAPRILVWDYQITPVVCILGIVKKTLGVGLDCRHTRCYQEAVV